MRLRMSLQVGFVFVLTNPCRRRMSVLMPCVAAEHFQTVRPPNVLLTTCYKPSGIMYKFLAEMLEVLPCATYYKRQVTFCGSPTWAHPGTCTCTLQLVGFMHGRQHLQERKNGMYLYQVDMSIGIYQCCVECSQGYALKKICEYATNRGFTDVIVFNEDRKSINGMLLVHLPGGPTAHFKLSNLRLSKDIKVFLYAQLSFAHMSMYCHADTCTTCPWQCCLCQLLLRMHQLRNVQSLLQHRCGPSAF